jgi:dihydroorotase
MLAQRGQMLIRMHGEVATVNITAFDYEKKLIEKKKFEE